MLELFLVTIAALSTLSLLVFLCVKHKYNVEGKMRESKCSHESKLNILENKPRIVKNKKDKTNKKKNGTKSSEKQTEQGDSRDIEKGSPNSTDSYSVQRIELDKDSTTSLLSSTETNTSSLKPQTPQNSTVYVNQHIASKAYLTPQMQKIIPGDYYLQRSQSDVEKSLVPQTQNQTQTQAHDARPIFHPLENSVSKRSLIPLPSTPDETNPRSMPMASVLKRGKSQGDLDVGCENIDLGYEALTMDRNKYKKRQQADIMKEMAIQENYARPKYYAQLKQNSLHGSLSDVTPPNSARTTKSFDFQQRNSKHNRGRSISIDPESSPIPQSPQNTAESPIETSIPNQYASELKPILSVIIRNMNREIADDSLSPVGELDNSPIDSYTSPVSEIHENSIYNLNQVLSTLSSQDTQTSEGSGISGASKKRYTNASSSSEGNFSNQENCLYESIENDLDTMLGSEISNKSQSLDSRNTGSIFDSELERSGSGKQNMVYYDSITMMRAGDSDESNATSGQSEDSSYGKFMSNPMPIEGCENYDTLTHFPCSSSKLDKWISTPDVDTRTNGFDLTKPAHLEQNEYDYLSEGEDEAFKPNINRRTRSVHDYEKINEADLFKIKPELIQREIGPF